MIKFFFMALISANLEGKPQVQFNTVSTLPSRNVTAADLSKIQDAAGQMLTNEGVTFDNIVIHNLFFLSECTEEVFFAGTQVPSKVGEETPAPADPAPAVVEDAAVAEATELLADADASAEAQEAETAVDAKAEVEETEAKAEGDGVSGD